MTEDMVPQPEDSYGIAKRAVEQELAASKEMFGLDYVIFRPHNVYGELQNIGDRYRNVLGHLHQPDHARRAAARSSATASRRAPSRYVGDVVAADRRRAGTPTAPAARSSTSAPTSRTRSTQLADDRRASEMGVPDHPVVHHEARNEVKHAFSDHCEAAAGVRRRRPRPRSRRASRGCATWAREHGPRATAPFAGIEIERNLPPSWRAATARERERQEEHFDAVAAAYDDTIPQHVMAHLTAAAWRSRGSLAPRAAACSTSAAAPARSCARCPNATSAAGVDVSDAMLDVARAAGLDVHHASGDALPFEDASFDLAATFAVLHHLITPELVAGTLREMCRVVKPGGALVAWDHNPLNPYWPHPDEAAPPGSG